MTNTTWILLRGLGREAGHWGDFAKPFGEVVAPDKVLLIDLPGSGHDSASISPASLNEIFRLTRARAIEAAGPQDKFSLLAISLGAMVAMEWLNQKPDELNEVVLINPSDRTSSPVYQRLRWQIWPRFLKLLGQPVIREREKKLLELLVNSADARAAALPLWVKLATDHPMGYRSFLNQLFAAASFGGLREATKVPVLLLNSLGDRLVDPSCSTSLSERWNWPLERHPWAGHDLTWDDTPWTLAKIRDWRQSRKRPTNQRN